MNTEEKRVRMLSMISAWRESGKSKKQYCSENGISSSTFYYWFSRSKVALEVRDGFVEIGKAIHQGAEVEVVYPNGVKLKVAADLVLLSQLIRLY